MIQNPATLASSNFNSLASKLFVASKYATEYSIRSV